MSSHAIAVTVYASIATSAVILEVLSKLPGSRFPGLENILTWVMRTRIGRVGVISGWAWVGLHYFAR
jgi:hypothetical protein